MKRYLTGIDWVVNALDYADKAQSAIGNHSEVILELESPPDPEIFTKTLNDFILEFPLLNGFIRRAINLCPYWKIPAFKKAPKAQLHFIKLDTDCQYLLPLSAQVNAAFKNKREYLVFTLLETDRRTFFGMTFDHRILDAKGAESFLHLFQKYYQEKKPPQIYLTCPAHLNKWREKFLAGKQINRFLLNLTQDPLRTLPLHSQKEPGRFKIIHLNCEQTKQLTDCAYKHAGYLMFMPYSLAKSIQIMHKIFQEKNIHGLTYLIPVPIDTRTKEVTQKEIFFNHFSFFLFKINVNQVNDLNQLIVEIKNQMYAQTKCRLPEAIVNASYLLRILSLPIVNFFLKLMSKKHFASFYFTYLNNSDQPDKFMQTNVNNIFHLPRTPKPPGVGIFFNQFGQKLNITLSYFNDLLTDDQATQISKNLESLANEN